MPGSVDVQCPGIVPGRAGQGHRAGRQINDFPARIQRSAIQVDRDTCAKICLPHTAVVCIRSQHQIHPARACRADVGVQVDIVLGIQGEGGYRARGFGDGAIDSDIARLSGTQRIHSRHCNIGASVQCRHDSAAGQERTAGVGRPHTPDGLRNIYSSTRSDRDVEWVDQPFARVAVGGVRLDAGIRRDVQMRRAGIDESAIPTDRRRGIQCAADFDRARLHVGQHLDLTATHALCAGRAGYFCALAGFEDDLAALQGGAVGADLAAVAHHGAEQTKTARTGDELADIGGIARRRGDVDAECGVEAVDEFDAAACCQENLAVGGGDDAGVLDVGGDEPDFAALLGGEVAGVADGLRVGVAAEAVASGKEVGVGEVQRCRDQPCHIDRRTCAK